MKDAIAVLPARGGSKRIPKKNIKDFQGRPAIGWPIATAFASGLFDRVVVTTDDPEIARIAETQGAEVPFLRDAKLSDDHSGTTEVVRDAVTRLGLPSHVAVCCIYPTAFFVTPQDLEQGYQLLMDGAEWVMTVGEYATPIERAYRRQGDRLLPNQPELMPMRSQDLEPAFFDAGQFYWAQAAQWQKQDARIWDGAAGVILPPERAVDIDTPADWDRAERLFKLINQEP